MVKTNKLKQIATLSGLMIGAFAISVLAESYVWTPADCPAPECNVAAPINISDKVQYKQGGLALGGSSFSNGYALDVNGPGYFTGLMVAGRVAANSLLVNGVDKDKNGYVLTNDGSGVAEWKPAKGGDNDRWDSDFCYALVAGRWTREGAFSGYYLKGLTKSSDDAWDAYGGVYCLIKGKTDDRMTAKVIKDLTQYNYLVVGRDGKAIVGKTYNQIVDLCESDKSIFGSGITCPLRDPFAN